MQGQLRNRSVEERSGARTVRPQVASEVRGRHPSQTVPRQDLFQTRVCSSLPTAGVLIRSSCPHRVERKCIPLTFDLARLHSRVVAVTVKQKNLPDKINGVQWWLNCLMALWPWASQPSSLELNILILSQKCVGIDGSCHHYSISAIFCIVHCY